MQFLNRKMSFFKISKGKAFAGSLGLGLMDALVAIFLGGIIIVYVASQFADSSKLIYDLQIKQAVNLRATAVLDFIGSEFKNIGNGLPFKQANFEIGDTSVLPNSNLEVTEPILVDASKTTASKITFRLNEDGEVLILTAAFDPAASSTINLDNVDSLVAGDEVYFSNNTLAEDDGYYGIIQSVNTAGKTITLTSASKTGSPGAIFEKGSVLREVTTVVLNSPNDWSGITRDGGYGVQSLGENTKFTLEFLDNAGSTVSLPLSTAKLLNNVRAIRLTVNVQSDKPLRDGSTFATSVTQRFALRNLTYL